VGVREGDHGSGPAGEWSLSSHSPGQEPWSVEFEELVRLRREAGDADGLDGELSSYSTKDEVSSPLRLIQPA